MSKSARDFLIERGFDRALGARPLRRAIERHLEDPLAEEILRGRFDKSEVVQVVAGKEGLAFKQKAAARK